MRTRFNHNSLNYSICIKDPNITIQGQFDSSSFQYLRINIDKCINDCKSDDEIKNALSKYKLSVYYIYASDKSESFENPIAIQMQNIGTNLDYHIYKRRDLFFMKNFLIDDENIVFKEKDNTPKLDFSSFDVMNAEVFQNNNDIRRFFGAFVRISSHYKTINRNYKKILIRSICKLEIYFNFCLFCSEYY
jgi:hypothetical protein